MKIPANEVTLDPILLGAKFKRHADRVILRKAGVIPPSHGRFAAVRNPSFLSINLIEALPSEVRQPRREDGDYPFVHYYFPNDFSTFHRDLNEEPWKRPYDEFDRIIQV